MNYCRVELAFSDWVDMVDLKLVSTAAEYTFIRTKAYNKAGGRRDSTAMKRRAKLVLSVAGVLVVLGLFLLPMVPISVAWPVVASCYTPTGSISCAAYYPIREGSVSASVMYAYFGVGGVQIPIANGHTYCLMYGNPSTMCGFAMTQMGYGPQG
jgi:hypothetical protein